MLSLIFPICNRTALFQATLQRLSFQSLPTDEYEIIVIDDGGTCPELVPLLTTYRMHGLPIRYYKIDVTRLPYPLYQFEGLLNNPAPAINVGIRKARYPRIVLSSPEVQYERSTNLDRMDSWPLAKHEALICDVFDPTLANTVFQGWIGGGELQRALNFLAVFHRDLLIEMGGFEERFIQGWGSEDSEFMLRFQRKWGGIFVFSGQAVIGYHQPHPRVENISKEGIQAAYDLCETLLHDPNYLTANLNDAKICEMGRESLIVERLWEDE